MAQMDTLVRRDFQDLLDQGDVKEGLDLQDRWGRRVIRAEMDMMVFLEDLDSKESLDYQE